MLQHSSQGGSCLHGKKRMSREMKNGMGHESAHRSQKGLKGEHSIQKDTENGNMVAIRTKESLLRFNEAEFNQKAIEQTV